MSNQEIQFEPYLDNDLVSFHNLFTFIDPCFNTSEIKPIMLSIPTSMRSKSKLSQKPPTDSNEPNEKGRLLTASTLKGQNNPEKYVNTNTESNVVNKEKEKPVSHVILDPIILKFVDSDRLFWMRPIPIKRVGCFHVLIKRSKTHISFQLFFDKTKPCLMSANFDNNAISNTLSLSIKDSEEFAVSSSYDTSNDTYFVSLTENGNNPVEICAANFVKPHIFDFYIPALKKNKQTGTSSMFPLPFDPSQSILLMKFKEKSQESIRLLSRLNDDPDMDTSFSGRFINKLPCNFILYHQSNKSKDVISFGQADESGYYLLNISYPTSTIQGFIAAIASHLSY